MRLADLGLTPSAVAARVTPAVERLIAAGNTAPRRARLAELMRQRPEATVGTCGLDETLDSIREEMRKFADGQVVPHAQQWHLRNHYIPLDVIAQMSELGVFSLTIPEDYGGMGLGKELMCVVSEELSRGYIGVAKTEIADEKTRRSVLRLALPLVLLPHVTQKLRLHSLLQRRQRRRCPPLSDHCRTALLHRLVAHHGLRFRSCDCINLDRHDLAELRDEVPRLENGRPFKVASEPAIAIPFWLLSARGLAVGVENINLPDKAHTGGSLKQRILQIGSQVIARPYFCR